MKKRNEIIVPLTLFLSTSLYAQNNYNPEIFWDKLFSNKITDKTTIGSWDSTNINWHYQFVENCIAKHLSKTATKIIDLGSGAGHWLQYFSKKYPDATIYGTDISKNVIKHLRERFRTNTNITNLQIDLRYEFINKRFDIINGIGFFHHLINDSIWIECLKRCSENLKPDGVLFVASRFDQTENFGNPIYRRFRNLEIWQSALKQTNLQIKTIYFTNPNPGIKRHLDVMIIKKNL